MSRELLLDIALNLHKKSIPVYKIEDGIFSSLNILPRYTNIVNLDTNGKLIPNGTILRTIYCNLGTVTFQLNTISITGKSINIFSGGYPVIEYSEMPTITKSNPKDTIWATWEIYSYPQQCSLESNTILKLKYNNMAYYIRDLSKL